MTTGITPFGSEFLVNTYYFDEQIDSSVTGLLDGGYVVTWTSAYQDGDDFGVYAQRYDSLGVKVGGEIEVNTYTSSYQSASTITGLANGGYVITWQSDGQDGSGVGIYGQRYTSAGVMDGTEFQVNTTTANAQGMPVISAFADGGFLVVWQSDLLLEGGYTIFAQRYDDSGVKSGSEFQVSDYGLSDQTDPSVAVLADGGFVVAWSSFGQDGGDEGVFVQRFTADGLKDGVEFQANSHTAGDQKSVSVGALADGGFMVVWESDAQDGSGNGIYGQRYDASGVLVGGEELINTYTTASQSVPSVAGMADGGYVVAWQSFAQDGSDVGIYAQRYDSAGDKIDGEFLINTTTDFEQGEVSIATLANGGFVITWQSDQDGDWFGTYGQQFDAQLYGTAAGDTIVDTIGADWISGKAGDDLLQGRDGRDTIYGGLGDDEMYGGARRDKIYGGGGKDTLYGGNDNDVLSGNGNQDTLIGGGGQDTMTGGSGADTFVFLEASDSATNTNADIIKDFVSGIDLLDFSALDSGLHFIGNSGFSGTAGEVRAVINGADMLVRVDVDGDGAADTKVVILGVVHVEAGDFIL